MDSHLIKHRCHAYLLVGLLGMVATGCAATAEQEVKSDACPVLDSRNWDASVDQDANSGLTLRVSGEVDLPTPGYQASFEPGPLDRRNPPGLRLRLSLAPPEGPIIQVIDTQPLSLELPTKIAHYREVRIICEGRELAVLEGITAKQ